LSDDVQEAVALAEDSFGAFHARYDAVWSSGMRAKLGLPSGIDAKAVTALADELLVLLKDGRVDYTSFFRQLSDAARGDPKCAAGFDDWVSRWRHLGPDAELMDRTNPIYIPRNHLVEEALAAATGGDLDPLERLLDAVTAPYHERPGLERYAKAAPEDFGPYQTYCGT